MLRVGVMSGRLMGASDLVAANLSWRKAKESGRALIADKMEG